MIRVVYAGEETASLDPSAVYEVLEILILDNKVPFYRIVDSMRDKAYYPASWFIVIDGHEEALCARIPRDWMRWPK